jgi:hypothetical protein
MQIEIGSTVVQGEDLMKTIIQVLPVLLLTSSFFAQQSKLPDAVVCSSTLAVLPQPGVTTKSMEYVDKSFRKDGVFQLVQDPNQADLVMLFWGHLGVIMTGSTQPWNPQPLWIIHSGNGIGSVAAVSQVVERERKSRAPCAVATRDSVPRTPEPKDAPAELLSDEILLKARTVAVIDHSFPYASSQPKKPTPAQRMVTKWLKEWGRFEVLPDAAAADLILIWYDGEDDLGYPDDIPIRGLLVFPNAGRPTWSNLPLWMVEGSGLRVWHNIFTEPNLVKDLKKHIAKLEAQTARPEPQKQ